MGRLCGTSVIPAKAGIPSAARRATRDSGLRRNDEAWCVHLRHRTSHRPCLRTVIATRYVTPLREGGSLPAIVEADDQGMYVLKFRGAGQGPKALIAELVAGEIARALGLPVPEIVFVELDAELARTEPDPEIQHLIKASAGLNLALDYLPGAVTFDPVVERPDAELASAIVWFDALVTNVDRTPRNANMLMWHRRLVADRSWRGALFPSRMGRLPRAQRSAVRADPRSRAAAAGGKARRSRCRA